MLLIILHLTLLTLIVYVNHCIILLDQIAIYVILLMLHVINVLINSCAYHVQIILHQQLEFVNVAFNIIRQILILVKFVLLDALNAQEKECVLFVILPIISRQLLVIVNVKQECLIIMVLVSHVEQWQAVLIAIMMVASCAILFLAFIWIYLKLNVYVLLDILVMIWTYAKNV